MSGLIGSILRGEEPASFGFRDETCAAFPGLFPLTPGHRLVTVLPGRGGG